MLHGASTDIQCTYVGGPELKTTCATQVGHHRNQAASKLARGTRALALAPSDNAQACTASHKYDRPYQNFVVISDMSAAM